MDPTARTRMCKEPEWRVSVQWLSGEQDPESGWGEKAPEMDTVERSPGPSQLVKGSTSLDSGFHKPSNRVWQIQLSPVEPRTGVLPRNTIQDGRDALSG